MIVVTGHGNHTGKLVTFVSPERTLMKIVNLSEFDNLVNMRDSGKLVKIGQKGASEKLGKI